MDSNCRQIVGSWNVIAVLTDSSNSQAYWRVINKRLKDEGNATVKNCNAFKMLALSDNLAATNFMILRHGYKSANTISAIT